ncbi:MAG: hypothetical protein ABWY34_04290 [Pseudoxanthomonas sp.]
MNKTAALLACLSTVVLLQACKPAEAPAPTPSAPAPDSAAPVAAAPEPAASTATATQATTPVVGAEYPLARDACLAEVARQTGVPQDKLVATEVLWAEAGVGVTVQVPDADAPWSCLSDEKGKVQGAAYTGSEGKL